MFVEVCVKSQEHRAYGLFGPVFKLFSVSVIKYPDKSNLWEEGSVLDHSFWIQSITVGNSQVWNLRVVNRDNELVYAHLCSAHFLVLFCFVGFGFVLFCFVCL